MKGYYGQLFSAFLRDNPQVKRIETQLALDNGNIGFKHLIAMLSKHPKFVQPDFTKTERVQFKECCSEISVHDYKDHLIEAIKQTPSYKLRFENGFEKIDKPRVEFNSERETFSIHYDAIRE